jgi:phosphoglycerate dehydrogenase-like enzyme
MTSVLILLAMPDKVIAQYRDGLRARFPDLTINAVNHHSKVGPYVGAAEVLVTFGPMMAQHVLEEATSLKWIQALGSGTDGITDRRSLRDGIIVTNIHGIHAPPVSEAAIMAMLALSRNLPRNIRNQDRRAWERWPVRLLDGKTAGIFGIGVIAEGLAPRLKALGMRVVGISSAKREIAGWDRIHGRDELVSAVRDLDYLVLLTPYTPATRHIVGEAVFSAMRPTSYLVNLARGGVVDEEALLAALREGRLAGAALDVFATEPLPEDHPFWSMENVIITPHLGGFYDEYPDRALPVIERNMRCFLAGDREGMINVVRR